MASYYKQVCSNCSATESNGWKKVEELGTWVCCDCFDDMIAANVSSDEEVSGEKISSRRYTRVTRSTKVSSQQSISNQSGKGRRWIFKKKIPLKSSKSVYHCCTSDYISYNNFLYQAGDVVMAKTKSGDTCFAQLRKFIISERREKCASVLWLLPTAGTSGFSPTNYKAGPEEEEPLKMNCFTYVMRLPLDFFKSYTTPYPHASITPEASEYIYENLHTILQKYKVSAHQCKMIKNRIGS